MRAPLTADERGRRTVAFLRSQSKKSVSEFAVSRMASSANLRKQLRQLIEEWVATRAEELAAHWLQDFGRDSEILEISKIRTAK